MKNLKFSMIGFGTILSREQMKSISGGKEDVTSPTAYACSCSDGEGTTIPAISVGGSEEAANTQCYYFCAQACTVSFPVTPV